MGPSRPASQPDKTSPAQPSPICDHGESKPHVHDGSSQAPPRVREEMVEKDVEGAGRGKGKKMREREREKQRDKNRSSSRHYDAPLCPLGPLSLSSQAHNRPSLPLAYLDSACFRKTLPAPLQTATPAIGLAGLQTTIPRLLSSQHAPFLTSPTRCGTAGRDSYVACSWLACTCGSDTNFLMAPPSVGPRTFKAARPTT